MSNSNLKKLQNAYDLWSSSKGMDSSCWFDIVAENVIFHSMGNGNPALSFARDRHSKQEMADYFVKLANDWTMVFWSPETYISEDDHVAVFGVCSWRNKQTGKIAASRI